MKNYLKNTGVTKLPKCLPTTFKKPEDEIFYINRMLEVIDGHFSCSDRIDIHENYITALHHIILLLPKYNLKIHPAYILALKDSLDYLEKFSENKIPVFEKGAIAFQAAVDYYSQIPPKDLFEKETGSIAEFPTLAKTWLKKAIKLRKESGEEVKRKPFLLIMKELNEEEVASATKKFLQDSFLQKANFYQQTYNTLFQPGTFSWLINKMGLASCQLIIENSDLSGTSFPKKTWKATEFRNVKLKDTNLAYNVFDNAKLTEVKLKNASAIHAIFKATELTKVKIVQSKLIGAVFDNAKLTDCDLSDSILTRANFIGATLIKVKINKSDLTDAVFDNAKLIDCEIIETDLPNANFKDTELSRVKITNSSLPENIFRNVKINDVEIDAESVIDFNQFTLENIEESERRQVPLSKFFKTDMFNGITVDSGAKLYVKEINSYSELRQRKISNASNKSKMTEKTPLLSTPSPQ